MKTTLSLLAALLLTTGFHAPASAWARANAWGGRTAGGFGGFTHDNAFGGSTTHSWYGGTSHTNRFGGTTTGAYGMGAVHTTPGGFTTYHPPAYGVGGYAPYYRPVAVPYYHAGCYDCAGAVAAGAVVGLAAGAVAGAAIARSADVPRYPIGVNFATLPAGAVYVDRGGVNYYESGTTWFKPAYGANGVYYSVVPAP
ncbi:MAG: hypothetical protein EOP82_26770 [Variovorax sp.]|nr:MAG: hypothetical protein EOP82_26770 [Variovorax sp.]